MSLPRIQKTLFERCLARRCQIGQRAFASAPKTPSSSSTKATPATTRARVSERIAKDTAEKVTGKASTASTTGSKSKASGGWTVGSGLSAQAKPTLKAQPRPTTVKASTNDVQTIYKKPFEPAKVPAASSTATTTSPVTSPAATADAVRTAEEREASLRAARLRRLAQREDMQAEEARLREAKEVKDRKYKEASRKWVSSIVALPILLVTSYYLFDRLALGHEQKTMPRFNEAPKKAEGPGTGITV